MPQQSGDLLRIRQLSHRTCTFIRNNYRTFLPQVSRVNPDPLTVIFSFVSPNYCPQTSRTKHVIILTMPNHTMALRIFICQSRAMSSCKDGDNYVPCFSFVFFFILEEKLVSILCVYVLYHSSLLLFAFATKYIYES